MFRYPWRFLLGALGIAWAVDLLFWGKPFGISFPLWVLLVLGVGIFLAWSEKARPSLLSIVMMLATVLFSVFTAVRSEPFTRFVNFMLAFFTLLLLSATFRNGNWLHYRVVDYIVAGFNLLVGLFSRPVGLIKAVLETTKKDTNDTGIKSSSRHTIPILRGLFLAVPVVLVLGLLLASADMIFRDRLAAIISLEFIAHIPEYIFRVFYIVFILGYLFGGAYIHGILPVQDEPRPDYSKRVLKPFLGWVESGIVLFSVNLLFVLFVVIQFQYFFGGAANITAAGYTYSEYARRGFGELVTVALLSLALYLALSSITRQETRFQRTGFSLLSILLLGLVLVMLVSAYQRLFLYESAYGFTRLRTYPHIFIIWLGLLLLTTMILEGFRRRSLFSLALLLGVFSFCLTLGAINVDGFIVRENVVRSYQSGKLDIQYLQTLSSDAVPEMVRQYQSISLPIDAKDKLGAELSCRTAMAEADRKVENLTWVSFHFSENYAWNWLQGNKTTWLEAYPTNLNADSGWMVKIGGVEGPCRNNLGEFGLD